MIPGEIGSLPLTPKCREEFIEFSESSSLVAIRVGSQRVFNSIKVTLEVAQSVEDCLCA